MARSLWTLYTFESGDTWVEDTDGLPRPNSDMPLRLISTQQRVILADGSKGTVRPETKYISEQLPFSWSDQTYTFLTQIQAYLKNDTRLKIVTHLSGEEFTGKFVSIDPPWLIGENPDRFNITAQFERDDS